MLSPELFSTTIRTIKRGPIEQARCVRNATFETLKRLKVKRNVDKQITATPAGSDQVNLRSLFTWLDTIEAGDKPSIDQLLQIDATAVARTS